MNINFVHDSPALLLESKKERILVIADLHIGLEKELAANGITVPSQLMKLQRRLFDLVEKTNANHVIILGDIKHDYKGIGWQEMVDVPAFFQRLAEEVKVTLVKGNHDGDIEQVLPKGIELHDPVGYVMEDVLLTHGQAWPEKSMLPAKTIIMGHIHPAVEFWSGGARSVEHVFMRAPVRKDVLERKFKTKTNLENAIIVPTFNHMSGGASFNRQDFEPIGPLLEKVVDWKNGEVFLVDGTYLGLLKNLVNKMKH